jgi:hypothetical protein
MKTYQRVIICLLTCAALAVVAIESYRAKVYKLGGRPSDSEIAFDRTVYDFGVVGANEFRTTEFSFTNNMSLPIHVAPIARSCGCVVAVEWPRDPVGPRERGTIRVVFSTNGFSPSDDVSTPLEVHFVDDVVPPVTLRVNVKVATEIDVEPTQVLVDSDSYLRLRVRRGSGLTAARFRTVQIRTPDGIAAKEVSRSDTAIEFDLLRTKTLPAFIPPIRLAWSRLLSEGDRRAIERLGITLQDKELAIPVVFRESDPSPFRLDHPFRKVMRSDKRGLRNVSEQSLHLADENQKLLSIDSVRVVGEQVKILGTQIDGHSIRVWLREFPPTTISTATLEITCQNTAGQVKCFQHRVQYVIEE